MSLPLWHEGRTSRRPTDLTQGAGLLFRKWVAVDRLQSTETGRKSVCWNKSICSSLPQDGFQYIPVWHMFSVHILYIEVRRIGLQNTAQP